MGELTAEQKERMAQEEKRLTANLKDIRYKIAVFSGKGGVGKTTVSVNLACTLQKSGQRVGLLDADVTGPNVPKMLGLNARLAARDNRILPLHYRELKVISIASILTSDQPVIWKGPMRSKLLSQFLGEADWGYLDYLIADLPPGTGDEIITIIQKMRPDIAVIVTTPQAVSLVDARRAVRMAQHMKVPHIGIIENMSGMICPHCKGYIDLFGTGGGKQQASELGVSFLGSIPVDYQSRLLADKGESIVFEQPESPLVKAIEIVTNNILDIFSKEELSLSS